MHHTLRVAGAQLKNMSVNGAMIVDRIGTLIIPTSACYYLESCSPTVPYSRVHFITLQKFIKLFGRYRT